MTLSAEQRRALDLTRPVCLSAGAGSGKTRVLIARYLDAVVDVGFDLDRVLAVSFTRKASAEVLARIRDEVALRVRAGGDDAPAWTGVRERLPDAWVMTIDAFCARLLAALGPAAGLPARRRILSGPALDDVVAEAFRLVIDRAADDATDPDRVTLEILFDAFGRQGLVGKLRALIERRGRAVPWAARMRSASQDDAGSILAAAFEAAREPPQAATDLDREQVRVQAALARVFERVLRVHRELLVAAGSTDFRQLLEDAARALDDERVRARFAARFKHVLVDEFQDTDPLQWEILRRLFGRERIERPGLFVVGDDKQAIFSFREGDVATFRQARREIAAAGGREETLSDNYRSTPALVAFCNRLSASMFAGAGHDFEATHAPMRAARAGAEIVDSRIELLRARGETTAEAREREHEAIAARIVAFLRDGAEVLDESPGGRGPRAPMLRDQAVLLRARTHQPELEAVLTRRGIPFQVRGGIGLYAQHEVRALSNLLRFLADPADDLALLGVLRSPLFAIADSVLLQATARAGAPQQPGTWGRITSLARAVRAGGLETPTPSDGPLLLDAVARLERYRALGDRLRAADILSLAVRESDLLATLDAVDRSGRAAANVDRAIDVVRGLERDGVCTLEAIVEALALADRGAEAPEPQADPPARDRDAVTLLTVHAAKGLEWPIVFVPGLEADVARGSGETAPLTLRTDSGSVALHAVKGRDWPEGRRGAGLRGVVTALLRREAVAEAKRLFYVAVTRARDHLVLTAAVTSGKGRGTSWLSWLGEAGDLGATIVEPAPVAPPPAEAAVTGLCDAIDAAMDPDGAALATPCELALPATAVSALERCPRRFYLEHVLGIPASPGPGAQGAAVAGPGARDGIDPAVRGGIVHEALEGIATGVDPDSRVAAAAERHGVPADGVEPLRAEVAAAVARFRAWPLGREILDASPGALASEVSFELSAGECRVAGAIDLLYRPDERRAVIVDFKTDRGAPGGVPEAVRWARERGYVDQLAVYAAAAHARFGGDVSAWLFVTVNGRAVPIVGRNRELTAPRCHAALTTLGARAAHAVATGFPLTPDERPCRDCPHRGRACPGVAAQGKKVDAADSSSIPPWYGFPCEASATSLPSR